MIAYFGCALAMAFCGIVYELILAQCATILYGGTILRYSTMIGLFIASLGLGAALWAWRTREPTLLTFWRIEIALSIAGLTAPLLVFALAPYGREQAFDACYLVTCAEALLIGFLSGMELPVLVHVAAGARSAGAVGSSPAGYLVGFDFLGTFAGALALPLLLYPTVGLVGATAVSGVLNALISVAVLVMQRSRRAGLWMTSAAVVGASATIFLWRLEITQLFSARTF